MANQAKITHINKITHIKYFVNFKRFLDSVEFLGFWKYRLVLWHCRDFKPMKQLVAKIAPPQKRKQSNL